MTFEKQIRPEAKWAERLRRLSAALLVLAAVFTATTVVDLLLLWKWEVTLDYANMHPQAGHAWIRQEESTFSHPAWYAGWWCLLFADNDPTGLVLVNEDRLTPLQQLIATWWPLLVVLALVGGAWAARWKARSLTQGSLPRRSAISREPTRWRAMPINWSVITSSVTSITAIGALVFTGFSLRAAENQNSINAESQITNRYTQAVELLGNEGDKTGDLRLGGIYALERIAHDSPRDATTVARLLAAFVRSHTPRDPARPCPPSPTADVQAALTVLVGHPNVVHDLRDTCLTGARFENAELSQANLSGADLTNAKFETADLTQANLAGATLSGAYLHLVDMTRAELTEADLQGVETTLVIFSNATMRGVDLSDANLERNVFIKTSLVSADLSGANLAGAFFHRADLTSANLDGADLTDTKFTETTGRPRR